MANKKLAKQCLRNNYEKSDKQYPDVVQVYQVETDKKRLLYWNSSNNKRINHSQVLPMIAEALLDDSTASVTDPMTWAEIQWEIEDK